MIPKSRSKLPPLNASITTRANLPRRLSTSALANARAHYAAAAAERRAVIDALPYTLEDGVRVYRCPTVYCVPVESQFGERARAHYRRRANAP